MEITKSLSELPLYNYLCSVVHDYDGDTITVSVDVGFHWNCIQHVRIYGIDAPEMHSTNPKERQSAIKAANRVKELCPDGSIIHIVTAKPGKEDEKFGRWLAKVTLLDGRDLATILISEGLAHAWDGTGKRPPWVF